MKKFFLFFLFLFSLSNASDLSKEQREYIIKYSKESIETSKKFGDLLYKKNNKIRKVSYLNKSIVDYIPMKKYFNLTDNQIVLGLMSNPIFWGNVKLIKINSPKIKKLLGMQNHETLITYNKLNNKNGKDKLKTYLASIKNIKKVNRTSFQKSIMDLDSKLNVLYYAMYGDLHNMFPIQNDKKKTWLNPDRAMKSFKGKNKKTVITMVTGLVNNVKKFQFKEANQYIDLISRYQNTFSKRTDILKGVKTLTDLNKLPKEDIEDFVNNTNSTEEFVKGMSLGINNRIKKNKGAIVIDSATTLYSSTFRDKILVQNLFINKESLIEIYSKEMKISNKKIEKLLGQNNVKENILKEAKLVNINAYCSVPMYNEILKKGAVFEHIYKYDNGSFFGSYQLEYIDCKNRSK
jgi:hypothetical protein